MTRALLLSLALSACGRDGPAVVDSDTAAPLPETDATADTRCTGTIALDLTAVPDDVGRLPVTWRDQGLALSTEPFEGRLEAEIVDGCLHLKNGALRIDLRPTRCGGSAATATIVDACGTTCSRLNAFTVDEADGEDRNTRTGAEDVLAVAPTTPFTHVVVSTLDARVCGADVTLAALPPDLLPPDTAQPF